MTMQDIRDLEDKTKSELDEERAKVSSIPNINLGCWGQKIVENGPCGAWGWKNEPYSTRF